jgi:predicted nucleic acid-binding protein
MLAVCTKVTHTDVINEITISIKGQYRIKLPDALIAATAIHMNVPLLSFDKGFSRIEELDLILPEL